MLRFLWFYRYGRLRSCCTVAFRSLHFGDLWAVACCGCSVPFWSLRSSLTLRSGQSFRQMRTHSELQVPGAVLFAVHLPSSFPPLRYVPLSVPATPHSTMPAMPNCAPSLRSQHSTACNPFALPPLLSPSCNVPMNSQVRIFKDEARPAPFSTLSPSTPHFEK